MGACDFPLRLNDEAIMTLFGCPRHSQFHGTDVGTGKPGKCRRTNACSTFKSGLAFGAGSVLGNVAAREALAPLLGSCSTTQPVRLAGRTLLRREASRRPRCASSRPAAPERRSRR